MTLQAMMWDRLLQSHPRVHQADLDKDFSDAPIKNLQTSVSKEEIQGQPSNNQSMHAHARALEQIEEAVRNRIDERDRTRFRRCNQRLDALLASPSADERHGYPY